MKSYQIAVILNIPANSYQEALQQAQEMADDLSVDALKVEVKVVVDYEQDNEGQRVLYLPSEEQPDDAG